MKNLEDTDVVADNTHLILEKASRSGASGKEHMCAGDIKAPGFNPWVGKMVGYSPP